MNVAWQETQGRAIPGPGLVHVPRLALLAGRSPGDFALELNNRWGDVVSFGTSGRFRQLHLFGTEANEFILSTHRSAFTWREAFRALEPIDGPTALALSDGETHRRRRRAVQPAFGARHIDACLPAIVDHVDRLFESSKPANFVSLRAATRALALGAGVHFVMGPETIDPDHLAHLFRPAMRYVNRPPQLQVPLTLGWARTRAARRGAHRLVAMEMARRRGQPARDDVLDTLLRSNLTKAEVLDQAVSLVAASYETTASAMEWTILELLRTPGEWTRARADVLSAIGTDAPVSSQKLRGATYLWSAVNESLRLWPAASMSGRQAAAQLEFKGYVIPQGSIVMFSPFVTHRMERHWGPDASAFRPSRWFEREPPPYAFIPFGGHHRRCIGSNLAVAEVAAVTARLLQRVTLRLAEPAMPVRAAGLAALHPEPSIRVIVEGVR